MANYYSILKKTISAMAQNSQESRNVLYEKARSTVERQLRSLKPALSDDVVSGKMQLLEDAIKQLDAEYGEAPAASETAKAETQKDVAKAPDAKIPDAKTPDTKTPVARTTEIKSPDAKPDEIRTGAGETGGKATDVGAAGQAKSNYVPAGNAMPGNVPDPVKEAGADTKPPAIDSVVSLDPVSSDFTAEGPSTADPLGMDYAETILAADPDTRARVDLDVSTKSQRSGVFTTLLAILLAISVVVGGLYALWINKEALINAILGEEDTQISEPVRDTASDVASEVDISTDTSAGEATDTSIDTSTDTSADASGDQADGPKSATRLTANGETVEVEPVKPVDQEPDPTSDLSDGAQSTSISKDPSDSSPNAGEPDTSAQQVVDQQVVELGKDGKPVDSDGKIAGDSPSSDVASSSDTADKNASQQNLAAAVAQKAFLYEEGNSGSGASRDIGAFIWSLGYEINEAGVNEAVIMGQLDVPGRNLAMKLVIKRNSDVSLPASHIIELTFQAPSDFSGGNISDVSRFVMKTSEQGRGEGLIAVPAKISDGNFLIALNNLDQALATNRKLLLESSWIDVPLGYTTGRRALVTLEKGAVGDKIFRQAFAEWDKK